MCRSRRWQQRQHLWGQSNRHESRQRPQFVAERSTWSRRLFVDDGEEIDVVDDVDDNDDDDEGERQSRPWRQLLCASASVLHDEPTPNRDCGDTDDDVEAKPHAAASVVLLGWVLHAAVVVSFSRLCVPFAPVATTTPPATSSSVLKVRRADFRTSAFHLCLRPDSDAVCDVPANPQRRRDFDAFTQQASAAVAVLRRDFASLVSPVAGCDDDEAAASKSSGWPTSVATRLVCSIVVSSGGAP